MEINSTKTWFKKYGAAMCLAVLLVFYGGLYFYKLGNHPFIDWDEAIYAQVAREALANHNSLDFTWKGNGWFEKPPLVIWLVELSFKPLGTTEFAARLPVVLFALATILLSYFFARDVFRSKTAGLFTVLAFSLMYRFTYFVFFLGFDVILGFFILLALYSFWKARVNAKWWYGFWAATACAAMTKNIIGFLPIPVMLLYSVCEWNFSFLKRREFYYGFLLLLVVVLPWHIRESVKFGKQFWDSYLLFHVLQRFEATLENHSGGFWYYLQGIKQNTVFGLLALLSFVFLTAKAIAKRQNYLYLLVSAAFIFLLFSVAHTKRDSYIVPLYPLLAVMVGVALAWLLQIIPQRWLKATIVLVMVCVFIPLSLQQNNFKVALWGNTSFERDTKNSALFIKNNFPDQPLETNNPDYSGPAFYYYSGKDVSVAQEPPGQTPTRQNRILHTQTRNFYQLSGYIYIDRQ